MEEPSITLLEGFHAIELAMEDGRVAGLFARTGTGSGARLFLFVHQAVIFATGGLGALYAVTTNPLESRGEGLGMAARAGAVIADPEFVQFHPTAIAIGRDPAPLATEALRGEGAMLVDEKGLRFMPAGPQGRRACAARCRRARDPPRTREWTQSVLDCREAIGAEFPKRFPTVYAACTRAGIDPARQPIPVAPAAHYHMGRHSPATIADAPRSNDYGPSRMCRDRDCTAPNRLASNSLLEALVFGTRARKTYARALLLAQAAARHRRPNASLPPRRRMSCAMP